MSEFEYKLAASLVNSGHEMVPSRETNTNAVITEKKINPQSSTTKDVKEADVINGSTTGDAEIQQRETSNSIQSPSSRSANWDSLKKLCLDHVRLGAGGDGAKTLQGGSDGSRREVSKPKERENEDDLQGKEYSQTTTRHSEDRSSVGGSSTSTRNRDEVFDPKRLRIGRESKRTHNEDDRWKSRWHKRKRGQEAIDLTVDDPEDGGVNSCSVSTFELTSDRTIETNPTTSIPAIETNDPTTETAAILVNKETEQLQQPNTQTLTNKAESIPEQQEQQTTTGEMGTYQEKHDSVSPNSGLSVNLHHENKNSSSRENVEQKSEQTLLPSGGHLNVQATQQHQQPFIFPPNINESSELSKKLFQQNQDLLAQVSRLEEQLSSCRQKLSQKQKELTEEREKRLSLVERAYEVGGVGMFAMFSN